MINLSRRRIRSGRSCLTLIELLIVCFIIVLFVAVAVPLLRPNTAETRVRDAARQLNAYVAEAKAAAAQRGRPVALVLDRSASEGARDPNIVTRLYIAEAPPHFSGDDLSSVVALHNNQSPTPTPWQPIPRVSGMGSTFDVTMLPAPPFYSPAAAGNVPPPGAVEQYPPEMYGAKASWYALAFSPPPTMLNVILASYLPSPPPSPSFVPFRIRFNGRGGYFDGYAEYNTAIAGGPWRYICWAPYGKSLPPQPPPTVGGVPYQIEFPPIPAVDSPLELPTGTVIDLQFSGYGPSSATFSNNANNLPLILVFTPGGDVERIYANGTFTTQVTRMHFLLGTLERAVEGQTLATSNLADPINQWVSVQARNGHVTTADIVIPTDFSTAAIAITQARAMAVAYDIKGGR